MFARPLNISDVSSFLFPCRHSDIIGVWQAEILENPDWTSSFDVRKKTGDLILFLVTFVLSNIFFE